MKRVLLSIFVVAMAAAVLSAPKPITYVYDNNCIRPVQVFTADRDWVVCDTLVIKNGDLLRIEPGTRVFFLSGLYRTGISALIVARGGKIDAQGTAAQPIIFTASTDNLDTWCDLGVAARGLWGGIVLAGYAQHNVPVGTLPQIEGFQGTNDWNTYGGNDDEDSSGVMTYCSIRHAGNIVSTNNEYNGLTMYAVGSRTVINHIEVFGNLDDGFEWFGGTVRCDYLISAFNADDGFDWDQGWRGRGQFWFHVSCDVDDKRMSEPASDHGAEMDGTYTNGPDALYSDPVVSNVTLIGPGKNALYSENNRAMLFKDYTSGDYHNMIVMQFSGNTANKHITSSSVNPDKPSIRRSIAWDFNVAGASWANITVGEGTNITLVDTFYMNPELRGVSREKANPSLDPRPCLLVNNQPNPVLTSGVVPTGYGFTNVSYIGAFGGNDLWYEGWTALDEYNIGINSFQISPLTNNIFGNGQRVDIVAFFKRTDLPVSGYPTVYWNDVSLGALTPSKLLTMPCGGYEMHYSLVAPSAGGVGTHEVKMVLPLVGGGSLKDSVNYTVIR